MTYNIDIGREGESQAEIYLQANGFKTIERNFRYKRMGEIDLIARKGDLILFIEVKRRMQSEYSPLYAITHKKKKTLRLIANQFILQRNDLQSKDITFRFDLIAIEGD